MRQLTCVRCGRAYEAKRSDSKFCGSTCKARQHSRPVEAVSEVVDLPPAAPSRLVVAVSAELEAAGRASTAKGLMALMLAEAFANPLNNGSQQAALMRELRACLEAALEGAKIADDPLDELRRRRALKRLP
jgi:hypothetical protein